MHWIALQPAPEDALADAPTAWAWQALQFTPLVARVDEALLLEVSASERLFGGPEALLAQLFEVNQAGARQEYAQGATSLIALGRLRQAASQTRPPPPPPPPPVHPDALPLQALSAARPHLATLVRLGVRNWGQLRALPRGGLVRRFGAGLVDALDRAYGQCPEVYPWLTLPEVFDAPLELGASVETAPALLFGARRLLAQLQVWLRARQRGALALELQWDFDPRRGVAPHGCLVLRTAEPTQDMQHLQRLLGEQLARITLQAPVLHLHLRTLQTQALAGESLSLLPDDQRHGDSLPQLLERLGARLGAQQVLCATAQADHRPECMQRWVPAVAIKSGANYAMNTRAGWHFRHDESRQEAQEGALYPSWLLAEPQALVVRQGRPQYEGPLTLLCGPQRLEAGWLAGDAPYALRDYYVARSAVAGLVWVYRERLGPVRWYLHGLFA